MSAPTIYADFHNLDVELDDALEHRAALLLARRLDRPRADSAFVNASLGAQLPQSRRGRESVEPFENVLERLLDDRESSRLVGRHHLSVLMPDAYGEVQRRKTLVYARPGGNSCGLVT